MAQVSGANILNLPLSANLGIDVSTRNSYLSTVVGYQAGAINAGFFNCIYGYATACNNKKGYNNIYFGTECATSAISGNLNVFYGNFAGQYLVSGSSNTFIGNFTGSSNNGYNNIFMGAGNNVNQGDTCNLISIGNQVNTNGNLNISIGNNTTVDGQHSLVHGNNNIQEGSNSIIIGENINNYANNCLILKNNCVKIIQDFLWPKNFVRNGILQESMIGANKNFRV